jgi:ribose 5-phosphate isomerase A
MSDPLVEKALERVPRGGLLGFGSGSTAERFLRGLARAGLRVAGVPTSRRTECLARELGLSLVNLEDVETLDLAVDGADEVGPGLDLVKGYGGALTREKIVAAAARRVLILADARKRVAKLGGRGRLPLEVVPFAAPALARALAAEGMPCAARPEPSDNGLTLLDARVSAIEDPAALERRLRERPGLVCSGLFLGMAHEALIEGPDGVVEVLR